MVKFVYNMLCNLSNKGLHTWIYRAYDLDTEYQHDDVIKWKHCPRYWPFVRGIHRSPVNSTHKGQWRGALMFSLIWAWINGWVNNRQAADLRRYHAHYDVIVMKMIGIYALIFRHLSLKNVMNAWRTHSWTLIWTIYVMDTNHLIRTYSLYKRNVGIKKLS